MAEIKFTNVSTPAAFGCEWDTGGGVKYQLFTPLGTTSLILGTKLDDHDWSTTSVTMPERFGMRGPVTSWREFAEIVRKFLVAVTGESEKRSR